MADERLRPDLRELIAHVDVGRDLDHLLQPGHRSKLLEMAVVPFDQLRSACGKYSVRNISPSKLRRNAHSRWFISISELRQAISSGSARTRQPAAKLFTRTSFRIRAGIARRISHRDRRAVSDADQVALLDSASSITAPRSSTMASKSNLPAGRARTSRSPACRTERTGCCARAFGDPVAIGRIGAVGCRLVIQFGAFTSGKPDPVIGISDLHAIRPKCTCGFRPPQRLAAAVCATAGRTSASALKKARLPSTNMPPGRLRFKRIWLWLSSGTKVEPGMPRAISSPREKWHGLIVARMENQGRSFHLSEQVAHVDIAEHPHQPNGIFRRSRDALHFVEPAHLLGRSRPECRGW